MKRIIFLFIALLSAFIFFTCDAISEGDWDGFGEKGGDGYERYPSAPDFDGASSVPGGENGGNYKKPSAGQLSCGEWSDIKNYDYYLNLFTINDVSEKPDSEESDSEEPVIDEKQRRNGFYEFIEYFGFETRYMVTVNVKCGGISVSDAAVELYDPNQVLLFSAKTDARGNAFLFPYYDLTDENIKIKVTSGSNEISQSFMYKNQVLQITLSGRTDPKLILDLMFVIDTTGSMGDELRYLKTEIADVIKKVTSNNPGYTINLALLFYRDIDDEYVTRYFDFTTNITVQQQNLSKQSANGGGDFPEASDRALWEAVNKKWNDGYAKRLIFHVCDAPPHDKQENQTLYFNSIKTAAKKGIRIIPVASSGIDRATEYLLRQEAIMTGGTYIFLTNDSGIGEDHLQPTIGEFTVEYLNACMVRVVSEYLTGTEIKPVPYYAE